MKILKPAEGRKVRHPQTGAPIAAEGVKVEKITTYWHRRLVAGDVVEVVEEAPKPKTSVKKHFEKSEIVTDQGEN